MTEQGKGLLILKLSHQVSPEYAERLNKHMEPIANELNARVAIVEEGLDMQFIPGDLGLLYRALQAQTAAIGNLTESIAALIDTITEEDEQDNADEYEMRKYLDGTPCP